MTRGLTASAASRPARCRQRRSMSPTSDDDEERDAGRAPPAGAGRPRGGRARAHRIEDGRDIARSPASDGGGVGGGRGRARGRGTGAVAAGTATDDPAGRRRVSRDGRPADRSRYHPAAPLASGQAVRRLTLDQEIEGSNPSSPANPHSPRQDHCAPGGDGNSGAGARCSPSEELEAEHRRDVTVAASSIGGKSAVNGQPPSHRRTGVGPTRNRTRRMTSVAIAHTIRRPQPLTALMAGVGSSGAGSSGSFGPRSAHMGPPLLAASCSSEASVTKGPVSQQRPRCRVRPRSPPRRTSGARTIGAVATSPKPTRGEPPRRGARGGRHRWWLSSQS